MWYIVQSFISLYICIALREQLPRITLRYCAAGALLPFCQVFLIFIFTNTEN
jgi:hypothetical protein